VAFECLKAGTAQKCGSDAYLGPGSNDDLGSSDDLGSNDDLGSYEDMIERGESIIPRGIIRGLQFVNIQA
jgi:hypothetical protein